MNWNWPSFKPEEVLSPFGQEALEKHQILLVRPEAMEKLQTLRDDLGLPLYVNHQGHKLRGYRHWLEHSTLPYHALYSQHLMGCAFDVSCYDMNTTELAVAALDNGFTGIGIYDSFVHMDIRTTPRTHRWDKRVRR